jgi:hypothetical protein
VWLGHIGTLRAEESLDAATISSMPWMEDDDRHEVLEGLNRAAGAETEQLETISEEDFKVEMRRSIRG